MSALEIISRKRDGFELTSQEISEFIHGVTKGSIPDYQISTWLMAVYIRGMTVAETLSLTRAMRDSGECIDLSDLKTHPTLDKHSTGGVGDKTTLVVVPLLAASGIPMLKMSGHGLGFSGGTTDKLAAIPGFRTELSLEEAKRQLEKIGAALIAQSSQLAPADKILYGLRDLTATIDCIPLIASSIMSKKLAAGADYIMLDVKVGRGAFMKTKATAELLASAMINIGIGSGVKTSAILTGMEEPLGYAVGNALEVQEAIDILQNKPDVEPRFRRLCIELSAHSLVAVGQTESLEEGIQQIEHILNSGKGAEKLAEIVAAQGGPSGLDSISSALPKAANQYHLLCEGDGFIAGIDAEIVGRVAMELGAGRASGNELIDPAVGIVLHYKTGARLVQRDTIATIHYNSIFPLTDMHISKLTRAFWFTTNPPDISPDASLILES